MQKLSRVASKSRAVSKKVACLLLYKDLMIKMLTYLENVYRLETVEFTKKKSAKEWNGKCF